MLTHARESEGAAGGREPHAATAPTRGSSALPRALTTGQFIGFLTVALPQLEKWASRMAPNCADALDLVQATCQRALEKRELFVRGSFYNVTRWLMTIMRNLHRDALRKWQHEQLTAWLEDLPVALLAPSPDVASRPRWAAIGDEDVDLAIAALKPEQREAYTLFAIDGLSYAQIASRLRIPAATVATRVFRARSRLRALLTNANEVA